MPRILSKIKRLIVTPGRKSLIIKAGLFQGIRMMLDLTYQTQLYLGLHEHELYKWIKKLSFGINTAIDIGAAEGEYALYFLIKTSAQKVFAFEPEKSLREKISSNLSLNKLKGDNKRLLISSKFVSAENSEKECTLDSLLQEILSPCLVKMDVDGGEVNVLQGATKLLNLQGVSWLVETHSQPLEKECLRIFDQAGYTTKVIPNAWWRYFIPEMRTLVHNRWFIATKKQII